MTNPAIADLIAQVTKATEVEKAATVMINGFSTRLQAAVDAALENGATAEQLIPVTDFGTALASETSNLAAAVEENT